MRGDIINYLHSALTDAYWSNFEDDRSYTALTRTVKDDELAFVVLLPDNYITMGFQFVPDKLVYNRKADFQSIKVITRNTPKYQYTGGSTTLSLKLDIYAETKSRQDVIERCRALESLTYTNGYKEAIPHIRLVWGALFRDEVWVVQSVNYELSLFKPDFDFMPQQAYVNITLLRVSENNLTWNDIK